MDETGYESTPHYKGSKKTTPKKGTGKGVCKVTGTKHEFLQVVFWDSPVFRQMYSWSKPTFMIPKAEVCVDCMGYRDSWYIQGETRADVKRKVSEWAGESFENVLVLSAKDLTDRVK